MSLEQRLAHAFLEAHPAEAALALERMPADLRVAAVADAPPASAAAALRRMALPLAVECVAGLAPDRAAAALGSLEFDAAATLFRRLSPGSAEAIIDALPASRRDAFLRTLRYPDGTAGALADPDVASIPADVSVAEARIRLRRAPRHLLYYLYVVDRDQRLVGVLDIAELLRADARTEVCAVMHQRVESLPAAAPTAVIRTHPAWRLYHSLPVVDDDLRLIGAIRYQTLRRLEHDARARGGPQAATITASALGELFHLGIAGLVEGMAAAALPRGAGSARMPPSATRTKEAPGA